MSGGNPLACFDRRYLLRVIAAALGIVVLALLGRWLHLEPGTPPRLVIGALEAVLMGYAIGLTIHSLRRLDEMLYRMQLEALAFAFAVTGITITGWGLMAKAGWPEIRWGVDTWAMMVLFWVIGLLIMRRRYQ